MQFQKFIRTGAINTDLFGKHREAFPHQTVDFRCDPKPFCLVEPINESGFRCAPDDRLGRVDTFAAHSPVAHQLVQGRNPFAM